MNRIILPCGAEGIFDDSGYGAYICQHCFAVYGSIGCPCSMRMKFWEQLKGNTPKKEEDETIF